MNQQGVTYGPRYPLIRLQALGSRAGIRYYRLTQKFEKNLPLPHCEEQSNL